MERTHKIMLLLIYTFQLLKKIKSVFVPLSIVDVFHFSNFKFSFLPLATQRLAI